jgi:hypothetical protein
VTPLRHLRLFAEGIMDAFSLTCLENTTSFNNSHARLVSHYRQKYFWFWRCLQVIFCLFLSVERVMFWVQKEKE